MRYPADKYEFAATTQDADGKLSPPKGPDWVLIGTSAAQDQDAAVLIATWARIKTPATPLLP